MIVTNLKIRRLQSEELMTTIVHNREAQVGDMVLTERTYDGLPQMIPFHERGELVNIIEQNGEKRGVVLYRDGSIIHYPLRLIGPPFTVVSDKKAGAN